MEQIVVLLGSVTLAVFVSAIVLFGLQHGSIKSQSFLMSEHKYRAALKDVERRFFKVLLCVWAYYSV